MLFYNKKPIKHKRSVSNIIKNEELDIEKFSGDFNVLRELYNFPESFSNFSIIKIFNETRLLDKAIKKSRLIKFAIQYKEHYTFEKFCKVSKILSKKRGLVRALETYQIIYGKELGGLKYKEYWKNNNITKFLYDPVHVSKKNNITIEEAKKLINDRKKKKATSLEGFILRHGEKKGKELFKKFQETSKHTLEKYKEKYENAEEKWNEYVSRKRVTSPRSIEYWQSKGFSFSDAKKKQLEWQRNNNGGYEYWRKRGLTDEEIKKKHQHPNKKTFTLEHYLRKTNGDIEKAKKLYAERLEKINSTKFAVASKESLKLFTPLLDLLLKNGYTKKNIRLGVEGMHELPLYVGNKKSYWYDFALVKEKLIIEYHGRFWHPENIEEQKQNPILKYDEIDRASTLKKKIEYAKQRGWKVLEIYSDTSWGDNWNTIINFLKTNKIFLNED